MQITYVTESDIRFSDGRIIKRGEELIIDLNVPLSIDIEEYVLSVFGASIAPETYIEDAIRITKNAEKIVNDLIISIRAAIRSEISDRDALKEALFIISSKLSGKELSSYKEHEQSNAILTKRINKVNGGSIFPISPLSPNHKDLR